MRELYILGIYLLVTVAKLCRPGGIRAVVAESLLLKQQLLISNRSRQRAPNLGSLDRFLLGFTALFLSRHRIEKVAALLSPATLFKFQKALITASTLSSSPPPPEVASPVQRAPRWNSSLRSSS